MAAKHLFKPDKMHLHYRLIRAGILHGDTVLIFYTITFFYVVLGIFMSFIYKIKEEKRDLIPAICHIDGTARLQTVNRDVNPLYWQLLNEFRKLTGVPILLNTSFNENEPIVCSPKEAIECFLRAKVDLLIIDSYLIKR